MASAESPPSHHRPAGRGPSATVVLRQLPALASVFARHLARDRWKAVSVALRAAPTPVRDLVRRDTVRSMAPVTAAVADAAAGAREDAATRLQTLAESGPTAKAAAVAAASAALERPDIAAAAIGRLSPDDPARLRATALRQWSDGDLRAAAELAERSGGRAARSLARTFRGELAALEAADVKALPERRTPPSRGPRRNRRPGPLRVLHVVSNALPEVQAGYTIRTQGLTAAQRAAGIDAQVVTRLGFPVDSGTVARAVDFEHEGVPTHRLLPRLGVPVRQDGRLALGVEHLVRLARELDVDVLHAHSKHDNGQVALLAGARIGVPVVYEARGFLEETWRSRGGDVGSDFYTLSRDAETACMRSADAVVAVSRAMIDDIVGRGIDPNKVRLVGNCVSSDFLGAPPDASALRAGLGLRPESVAVGVVSTLNDYEGLDVLVEAVARVADPRLTLVVVGDGPARADLERLATRLLPGRATFTGRVPHAAVREHHAALDVFCVPRLRTPVTELVPPLKPLEAMATARPLVVSDLPPLLELVGAADVPGTGPARAGHGLVATAGDPGAWAEALRVLLYDPALRQRLGRTAREWVREERTWEAAARTYGDLYAEVMNAPGLRPGKNEGAGRGS